MKEGRKKRWEERREGRSDEGRKEGRKREEEKRKAARKQEETESSQRQDKPCKGMPSLTYFLQLGPTS
jgi:hypothetical protein